MFPPFVAFYLLFLITRQPKKRKPFKIHETLHTKSRWFTEPLLSIIVVYRFSVKNCTNTILTELYKHNLYTTGALMYNYSKEVMHYGYYKTQVQYHFRFGTF